MFIKVEWLKVLIDMPPITFEAVLMGCRTYPKTKGGTGFQYTFSGGSMMFDLTGNVDLSDKVSDIAGNKFKRGKLVVDIKVFNAKPYLAFNSFNLN